MHIDSYNNSKAIRQKKSISRDFSTVYLKIFILQIFLLAVAGSLINVAIYITTCSLFLLSLRGHGLFVVIMCSCSVVFQVYSLSINSRHDFFTNTHENNTCYLRGIANMDNLYTTPQIQHECSVKNLVTIGNQIHYQLQEYPHHTILYGFHNNTSNIYAKTCEQLNLSCFRWKIKNVLYPSNEMEPCWEMTKQIYASNVKSLFVTHSANSVATKYKEKTNVSIDNNMFVYGIAPLNSNVPIKTISNREQTKHYVDKMPIVPDKSTFFVVVPHTKNVSTSVHVEIGAHCENIQKHKKFFHTGVIRLSSVATPCVFTMCYIFSSCSTAECNFHITVAFLVFVINVFFCLLTIYTILSFDFDTDNSTASDAVYYYSRTFFLTLCVVSFNWVSAVSLFLIYIKKMRLFVICMLILQGVTLSYEFYKNQFGSNTNYMLTRIETSSGFTLFLMPFIAWDNNIYNENCVLYLVVIIYIIHIMSKKNQHIE